MSNHNMYNSMMYNGSLDNTPRPYEGHEPKPYKETIRINQRRRDPGPAARYQPTSIARKVENKTIAAASIGGQRYVPTYERRRVEHRHLRSDPDLKTYHPTYAKRRTESKILKAPLAEQSSIYQPSSHLRRLEERTMIYVAPAVMYRPTQQRRQKHEKTMVYREPLVNRQSTPPTRSQEMADPMYVYRSESVDARPYHWNGPIIIYPVEARTAVPMDDPPPTPPHHRPRPAQQYRQPIPAPRRISPSAVPRASPSPEPYDPSSYAPVTRVNNTSCSNLFGSWGSRAAPKTTKKSKPPPQVNNDRARSPFLYESPPPPQQRGKTPEAQYLNLYKSKSEPLFPPLIPDHRDREPRLVHMTPTEAYEKHESSRFPLVPIAPTYDHYGFERPQAAPHPRTPLDSSYNYNDRPEYDRHGVPSFTAVGSMLRYMRVYG